MSNKITSGILDGLAPQARRGRPPVVRRCPYCHSEMNATAMRRHRPGCAHDHNAVPPEEQTLPQDLENQEPSSNPLERLRQIDQQEQDRLERS